jgi:hypothetical protein
MIHHIDPQFIYLFLTFNTCLEKFMATQLPVEEQAVKNALDAFIQTASMEEGRQVLQRYPELLTEQADLLFKFNYT